MIESRRKRHLTSFSLIFTASLFLTLFYNISFFRKFFTIYPVSLENVPFAISVAVLLFSVIALLLILVDTRITIKPVLIVIFIVSSLASYFMDSYNVVIDSGMIQNVLSTDFDEAADMVNYRLVMYLMLLGVLPGLFVYNARISYKAPLAGIVQKLKYVVVLMLVIIFQLLLFGDSYASFFREHKKVRYYTNPVIYLYSIEKHIKSSIATADLQLESIGQDAHIVHMDAHRELTILVVGETMRADRMSLNGYTKITNPLLQKERIISLKNMRSCGTSTAVSVPCMFSMYTRDNYDDEKGASHENLLDVLKHAGVHVLWRDNNSDSKGVALRVKYEDYKSPALNHACDKECRDIGMLEGLQEYIDSNTAGDILIVLHQMGSHGPAYYKRYPESFEKFRPVCKTSHLEDCTEEEISNSYDNTVLYTDYFLSNVIELLRHNQDRFETALMYVSDHGESLGENGIYLHGLPGFLAPDSQTHVASLLWFGENYDEINVAEVSKRENRPYSHDNIFHTVLGLMEIETGLYDRNMDIIYSD